MLLLRAPSPHALGWWPLTVAARGAQEHHWSPLRGTCRPITQDLMGWGGIACKYGCDWPRAACHSASPSPFHANRRRLKPSWLSYMEFLHLGYQIIVD